MQIPIGCGRVLKSVEWCVYGGGRFWRSSDALYLRLNQNRNEHPSDINGGVFFVCIKPTYTTMRTRLRIYLLFVLNPMKSMPQKIGKYGN